MGALERAKLAVEKHYAVVGVLEDMNTTLTVLENYIPRFFQGATDVYYGKWSIKRYFQILPWSLADITTMLKYFVFNVENADKLERRISSVYFLL